MTDQVDMSQFIAARSDQMNADDLLDAPRTITVTKVSASPDSAEQPVSIHYEGDQGKPFKPCKTVRRILVGVWGKDASQYVGRSMTLYRDPTVAFGGMQVGGIRVSHMSHMNGEKTVALMVTRGRKAPFKVLPLATKVEVQPADEQAVALKAITDAAEDGMDALANVWKQKWMAPHREALQLDLDRLKVVAEAKDKPATDTPSEPATLLDEVDQGHAQQPGEDPAAARANAIIDEIKAAISTLDVKTIQSRNEVHIAAMEEALAGTIETVANARIAEIEAGREKAKAAAE